MKREETWYKPSKLSKLWEHEVVTGRLLHHLLTPVPLLRYRFYVGSSSKESFHISVPPTGHQVTNRYWSRTGICQLMTFRPGNDTGIWWKKGQNTYSGDDSGVKLDISSGVGTARARTAKEREEKRNMIQYIFHFQLVHQWNNSALACICPLPLQANSDI